MSTTEMPHVRGARYRWLQLFLGIVCMAMVANLQYGWTLFVNPIDAKFGWGRAAIQVAFTIFVLTETWLVPIEGYLVDKFTDRTVHFGSSRRCRGGRGLWHLRRQCAQMVSGPPRSCGRFDGGWIRRRLGTDGAADSGHHQGERL
jgi:hypothetical protein